MLLLPDFLVLLVLFRLINTARIQVWIDSAWGNTVPLERLIEIVLTFEYG